MAELVLEQEVPSRAMVVIPHPDDGEIGCGGTVVKWVQQGCEVTYVLCTNGDKGSNDPDMTPERLASIREREQLKAANILGVREVVFLRHPDGGLEDDREFRGELVREIRRHAPEVVLCADPFRRSVHLHRDHRISGQVTLDAVFPYARDHLHYPEHLRELGLRPHKVGAVYMWATDEPNLCVDITDTVELKVQALKQHVSQVAGSERDVGQFLRERAREAASRRSIPYTEAFRKLSLRR